MTDTGFDGILLVSKRIFDKNGGLDEKHMISKGSNNMILANYFQIPIDVYKVTINIGTEKIPTEIRVTTKDIRLLHDAFIGRKILDNYKVVFNGRSEPKKLEFE